MPQTSNGRNGKNNVEYVLTTPQVAKTCIKQTKGLGPANTDNNARPWPLEGVLASIFDRRTALANDPLFKGSGTFAKKRLSRKDRWRKILEVRFEFVQRGLDRNLFRIRDVKLF